MGDNMDKSKKTRLAIFTADRLRTSTGSNSTTINILNQLNTQKYSVDLIIIDTILPDYLLISDDEAKTDISYINFNLVISHPNIRRIFNLADLSVNWLRENIEIAIVSIYNEYGEDGRLIGFLETLGIPYLSPDLRTSALCTDKSFTKAVLRNNNINVPKGFEVNRWDIDSFIQNNHGEQLVRNDLGYPVIIKPNTCGASRGTSVVKNKDGIVIALKKALQYSSEALIEEFIPGQEFSVGTIGHFSSPTVMPIVQIKHDREFFDYIAKYSSEGANEICPAPIEEYLEKAIVTIVTKSYKAVRCTSHARVDLILTESGKIFVLEINTFPGLTPGSIFPKALISMKSSLVSFLEEAIQERIGKNLMQSDHG